MPKYHFKDEHGWTQEVYAEEVREDVYEVRKHKDGPVMWIVPWRDLTIIQTRIEVEDTCKLCGRRVTTKIEPDDPEAMEHAMWTHDDGDNEDWYCGKKSWWATPGNFYDTVEELAELLEPEIARTDIRLAARFAAATAILWVLDLDPNPDDD